MTYYKGWEKEKKGGKKKKLPLVNFFLFLLLFHPATACAARRTSQTENNSCSSCISISVLRFPSTECCHTIDFPSERLPEGKRGA